MGRARYALALEPLDATQRDALSSVVREAVHRRSVSRLAPDVPSENGLTRASVRVPVDLPVRYETPSKATGTGRATNLSSGGLLIVCAADLPIGSALTLAFSLPARDATAITIHARIVASQRFADSSHYNLAFYGADASLHEAIDRCVYALLG